MAPTRCWSLSVSLLTILIMIQKSKSAPSYVDNDCSNTTMFDPNSEYQSHLNTIFNSLSSNATNPTGFSTASSGNTVKGEVVSGLFLCRGDMDPTGCKDCVTTAISDLTNNYCPNRKVAVIWYDECMVRYSNLTIFSIMADSPRVTWWRQQNVTGNVTRFKEFVKQMAKNVSIKAASDGSNGKKFGTDVQPYDLFQKLYVLVQCTPDLTPDDCYLCLTVAIDRLRASLGCRALMPSCNVRYESIPFFSLSLQPPRQAAATNSSSGAAPVVKSAGGKKQPSAWVKIAIVAPIVVAVVLLVAGVCLSYKKAKKRNVVAIETGEDFSAFESLQYDLSTLQSATNNFSDENKLGQGGFGCVYKGILQNGQEIAVKKLSKNSSQGIQEFKNEASLVAKLQHRNLVRLLGFCLAGDEKLLIYEYVPNKSLDYFIFDPEKQGQLSWERRRKIIEGIARGVLYIHQDSQLRIIHRDLKASNILLDLDMSPKISDFGLARIFGVDQTQGNTNRVVGTYGYMSPEYAMHGQFSVKSDVYSFGVLMLEIISGKRNSSFDISGIDVNLLSYAWKQWRDGLTLEFVDPTIRDSCSTHEVMRYLHLALICVQDSIDARPNMATIVLTLDSYSVTLQVPKQPGLILKGGPDQSVRKLTASSINDITVSKIDAR